MAHLIVRQTSTGLENLTGLYTFDPIIIGRSGSDIPFTLENKAPELLSTDDYTDWTATDAAILSNATVQHENNDSI